MGIKASGMAVGHGLATGMVRAFHPGPFAIWLVLVVAFHSASVILAGGRWDWGVAATFLAVALVVRVLHVAASPKLPVWARAWHDAPAKPVPTADGTPARHPISAVVWRRRDQWVLELSGTLGDTFFTCRHTEPLSTPIDDVPGLPSRYRETRTPASLATAISTAIAELGDRSSPDGQPDMMLVTAREIQIIVENALASQMVVADPDGASA